VVQLRDPAEAGPEMEHELIAFCRSKLAKIKCPVSIDFADELPRTPSGKLLKRLLKEKYWNKAAGCMPQFRANPGAGTAWE
jgi:long-chain acyl-CoA synthetase